MKRGALINDLNEIVQLAEDKCSVVIYFGELPTHARCDGMGFKGQCSN